MSDHGRMDVGWIWLVNVQPFVDVLSWEVGHGFDDSDRIAIERR